MPSHLLHAAHWSTVWAARFRNPYTFLRAAVFLQQKQQHQQQHQQQQQQHWVLADVASRSASQLRKKESKAACFAKEGGIANGFAKDGGITRGFTKKAAWPKKVASPKNGVGDKCVAMFHMQYSETAPHKGIMLYKPALFLTNSMHTKKGKVYAII